LGGLLIPAPSSSIGTFEGIRGGRGRRSSKANGFTLIEVLLALAILALVVMGIYQSFSNAGQNIQQAEEVRDETDTARTLLSRLTADLNNAYVNGTMSGTPTFFYGKKVEDEDTKKRYDEVSFTTLTNWRRPNTAETELWELGYSFQDRPEEKKHVLMRREKRELSKDVPPREGGVEYELTDQVQGMQIRYSNDGTNWSDDWPMGQSLPRAVEIVLTFADGRVYETQVDIRYQQ
jgi:type II secretion system protein J